MSPTGKVHSIIGKTQSFFSRTDSPLLYFSTIEQWEKANDDDNNNSSIIKWHGHTHQQHHFIVLFTIKIIIINSVPLQMSKTTHDIHQ